MMDGIIASVEPAAITSTVTAPAPAGGAGSLVDRDRLVGGGAVSYMCVFEGIPTPTVTWYFNGERIPTDSGISENGNQVVIAAPLVVHSGVYQCVVSNVIDGVVQEDRRAWVVEVREPRECNSKGASCPLPHVIKGVG